MGWQDAPVVSGGGWQSAPVIDAAPPEAAAPEAPLNWSDVPGQAARNFLPSLSGVMRDLVQPVIHPIDTATALKNVGQGVLEKTGLMSGDEHTQHADAVGQYFVNRYGSAEGWKQALAKDPAGVVADISSLLTGGEALLARAPGMVGKAASVAGKVGRYTDPINLVTKPAMLPVKMGEWSLGGLTGVGATPVTEARLVGREGGAASEALTSQMRGKAPIEEIVADARSAADQMRKNAQASYQRDMQAIGRNPAVLDFKDIDAALQRVDNMVYFNGRPREKLLGVRNDLVDLVNQYKALPPQQFHTPAGFDNLKKEVYDIIERLPFEHGTQRKMAGDVFGAIKDTIAAQDPLYAKTMANYERYSTALREIEKTLSLKPGATVDTALRKLTSIMRNNVNSSFGKRAEMVSELERVGAPNLTSKIAGASLNSWEPRSLSKYLAGGEIGSALLEVLNHGSAWSLAAIPATLAATSPRLAGVGMHALGVAQRYMDSAYPALKIAGRTAGPIPRIYVSPNRDQ
ncbi:hypothetical protein [Bradyrhizobium sp. SEMIA]|uniref:hypothetical protein n=1 Tax=Bradyrhizobium sp. SEMIA TaxID=2597515 RepID=UPI0018A4C657|nr:hypothetical protein [Bradyrhizobium sp. SEMIA]QOG23161.1 hypothetical protein FOM02_43855 [Bradyrhizobium sp. SEMIA]